MRARDGVEEDLSAYAREDLVYKAKLAEQAERCARMNASNRSARVDKEWDGRRVGTTAGCLVDDGARRAREETFEARVDRASRVVGGGGGGARIDDADDDSRRARARVARGADDDR